MKGRDEKMNAGITYAITQYVARGPCRIIQKFNGFVVNEYTAYDCKTYFSLYPRRRIMPSVVPLVRHKVSIYDVKREY